jgi:predicted dehydrogenase
MDLVGVGVVGYGYWGPNLVRNFANSETSRVLSVSDLDQAKLAASKRLHSDIVTTSDFRDLLRDPYSLRPGALRADGGKARVR